MSSAGYLLFVLDLRYAMGLNPVVYVSDQTLAFWRCWRD